VKVLWKEGSRQQELEVVQFLVTEEQLILPDDDEGDGGVAGSPGTGGSAGSQIGNQAPGTNVTPSRAGVLGGRP
jgi:hypothetical protein